MSLQFQVLGPLRLRGDCRHVAVGPQKPRTMLAVLLLSANESVPLDRLTAELWERPPRSAVANLRTYASGLRRLLLEVEDRAGGADRLVASPSGYLLRVDPPELDLHRFQAAAEAGRCALSRGDYATAMTALRTALGLWRGRPVQDVFPGPDLAARITVFEEQYLTVVEDLMAARLAVGEHTALTAELRLLIAANPFRERLRCHLMLALYRAGDVPAALAAYAEARAAFADQLGIELGAELSRLQQAILRRDPALSEPAVAPGPDRNDQPAVVVGGPAPVERPRQLPPNPVTFVGRTAEVAAILRAAAADSGQPRDQPPVVVLHGPSGMGKSTVAVRAAHLLAEQYPDGQLHLELRPGMEPAHAVGGLLRGLGVPRGDVPAELTEAAAMFRSATASRRLLIVLDGADGVHRVRSLLPAGPGCAVIITSRRPLSTLDATRLRLDRLSFSEGMELLDRLTGDGRVAAEPVAAARLVSLCDGHPLALRIAGARLADRTDWSIAVLADRLGNERERLDELRADDLAMRSSFRESHRELAGSPDRDDVAAAAAFPRLALLRAPEISVSLAAAVLGVTERRAQILLDRLTEAHLLEAVTSNRFRFHDLLRLYAVELAEGADAYPSACIRNSAA